MIETAETTRRRRRPGTRRTRRLAAIALAVCAAVLVTTAVAWSARTLPQAMTTARLQHYWGVPLDGGSLVAHAEEKGAFGDGDGVAVYAFPQEIPPALTRAVPARVVTAEEVVEQVRRSIPDAPASPAGTCRLVVSDDRGHLAACLTEDAHGGPGRVVLYETVV